MRIATARIYHFEEDKDGKHIPIDITPDPPPMVTLADDGEVPVEWVLGTLSPPQVPIIADNDDNPPLVRYDAACKAIAEARKVDEVQHIRDQALAMRAAAKIAKNRNIEIDAAEIRVRAERRLGELIKAQKETVGLATGGRPYQANPTGSREVPVEKCPPTLAEAGIDKKLSSRAQKLANIPDDQWEADLANWRAQQQESSFVIIFQPKKAKPPKPAPLRNDVDGEQLRVLVGDCMARLKEIPDASIDCVITSPPYFRTFIYSGAFTGFGGDPTSCEHEWQMHRFIPTGYGQRGSTSEARNWSHGKKLTDEDKTVEHGTCRKCGAERVMVGWEETVSAYIDHLVAIFAEVKRILKPGGVFWLNIADRYANKSLSLVPQRLAIALVDAGGWICRSEVIWHILNKTPESVTDRPTRDFEPVYMFVKQPDHYFDADAVKEPARSINDPRRGNRVEYHGKYVGDTGQQSFASIRNDGYRNLRTVWSIANEPLADYDHYCSFPKELVRRMVLAGSPVGGTILDPFAGTGTAGLVANALERRAILIEASSRFAAITEERIRTELPNYKAKIAAVEDKEDWMEAAE